MKFKYAILDAVKTLASDAFIQRMKEDSTMLKHLTILHLCTFKTPIFI